MKELLIFKFLSVYKKYENEAVFAKMEMKDD